MPDYTALKTVWASLPAGNTAAQNLAAVNAMTVSGPVLDVAMVEVEAYLALNGKLYQLGQYAKSPPSGASVNAVVAANELMTLINAPGRMPLRMSQPAVYAAVQTFLDALAADSSTGITAADVTALLALTAMAIPWATATVAEGGGGLSSFVNEWDLVQAGILTEEQVRAGEGTAQ